jgi:hypothetical protein
LIVSETEPSQGVSNDKSQAGAHHLPCLYVRVRSSHHRPSIVPEKTFIRRTSFRDELHGEKAESS